MIGSHNLIGKADSLFIRYTFYTKKNSLVKIWIEIKIK